MILVLPIKKGGFLRFFGFKKVFYSKGSKSTKNCSEYNASLLEGSHLEGMLYTELLSDQMRAGSWLEMLKLFGFGVFFVLSEELFTFDVFYINENLFFLTLLSHQKKKSVRK